MEQVLVLGALVALVLSSANAGTLQTSEDGNEYFIESEQKFNWYEALNECSRMNMSLVAIDSHNKSQQISNLMTKLQLDIDIYRLWSGGNDNAVTGRYGWISTGAEFTYTNWNPGEPNDDAEHCVMIFSNTMHWHDVACARELGFICEIKSVGALKNLFEAQAKQLREKTEELDALKQSSQELHQKYEELSKDCSARDTIGYMQTVWNYVF